MAYHTAVYLFVFLPIVLLLYQITPKRGRWIILLSAGYTFFWIISGELVIFLIGTTLFTYGTGVWINRLKEKCRTELQNVEKEEEKSLKQRYKKRERLVLTGGISVLLAVLAYLKYYNFFAENINGILGHMGLRGLPVAERMILPIGISFYTLQAIGYMVDVYWEKIGAPCHLGKLALFLSFFPQIMEGPIGMYSQTAEDLWKGESLRGDNLSGGCLRILWGLFKKLIIADRLYVFVTEVFDHYEKYSGIVVLAAAVSYTVQLYMEFSGCMDIIIGSGKLFGITLPENFRQPFASRNPSEFWRRWHITLGVWLKTYVFYPVSVSGLVKKWNKFGKKHGRKYITKLGVTAICLFPVWFCNGLWHGPKWTYIFYGMYYFVILLCSAAVEPLHKKAVKKFHINEDAFYWRTIQVLKTWIIIFTGELFFRANALNEGFAMFKSIFVNFEIQRLWDGTFLKFGLDKADYMAVMAGCLTVALVGMIKERNLLRGKEFKNLNTPVRWAVYYGLILAVIIFGAYGVGYQQVDMIYAGF